MKNVWKVGIRTGPYGRVLDADSGGETKEVTFLFFRDYKKTRRPSIYKNQNRNLKRWKKDSSLCF